MSSNSDWIVPAGSDARRFAVFAVNNKYKGNTDYFTQLGMEMSNGGLAAMLHELLHLDLTGWHPEAARPETKELTRQKLQSLGPLERVFFDCLLTGAIPGATTLGGSGCIHLPTRLLTKIVSQKNRRDDITDNKVAELLGQKFEFVKREDIRPRGYEIPALPEARRRWNERMFVVDWDESEKDWDTTFHGAIEDSRNNAFS
jgi:hypothetical protein